jgi:hypothetical protein
MAEQPGKFNRSSICAFSGFDSHQVLFILEAKWMKEKENFPSRDELDKAFTLLQDQITRITVDEEEEMVRMELENEK